MPPPALVVNDYFGGKILNYRFPEDGGHYSNLIDGKEVDLTREQFSPAQRFPDPEVIERKDTEETDEYKILRQRVEKALDIF